MCKYFECVWKFVIIGRGLEVICEFLMKIVLRVFVISYMCLGSIFKYCCCEMKLWERIKCEVVVNSLCVWEFMFRVKIFVLRVYVYS